MAKEVEDLYNLYGDIAMAYSEISLFEKSTEYWFKFLNCAPEDEKSEAYEALAMNYFYQDKMFEAGYYLHKKILKDGYISREGVGEEIAEFLSADLDKKECYHIAYPFDRADYSYQKSLGKKAFEQGDYYTAKEIYSKIPKECMDEESFGDMAVSSFFEGDDEATINACRESIELTGENITAYCTLSTYYHNKENHDKSAYYYKKALSLFDRGTSQSYQMASCAIEQNDHFTVNYCLSNILQERKYDITMRVYYAISFINTGDYESALREFSFALRLNPLDRVVKYYCELSSLLASGNERAGRVLPLKYNKNYPEKITEEYKKLIGLLISEKKDLKILKNPKNLDALYWGINSNDEQINKECAILLWFAKNVNGRKILTDLLMDMEIRSGVKRVIIYTLMIFNYTKEFGVIAGNRFTKIKRAKLCFEDCPESERFLYAYATVMARTAFWEIDDNKKFAKSINNLYKKYKDLIIDLELDVEELSVVTICLSGIDGLGDAKEMSALFGVKYSRIKNLVELVRLEQK
ncbi:MAG: hypothetical protein IJW43_05545 [Clostridia bacterium]|nr:hypothetical protein [Clostridia bacterium]